MIKEQLDKFNKYYLGFGYNNKYNKLKKDYDELKFVHEELKEIHEDRTKELNKLCDRHIDLLDMLKDLQEFTYDEVMSIVAGIQND